MKTLTILLLTTLLSFGQESPNYALVIGVRNYTHIAPLRNSLNDARDMANLLKAKGFRVDEMYDPKTKDELREGLRRYMNYMTSKEGGIGVVYYSGHGIQEDGENYLIPADAQLEFSDDLKRQCIPLGTLLSVATKDAKALHLFIIDACRTNNIPSITKDLNQGLAPIQQPAGSMVIFATQPGKTASDGEGRNGLFTEKLLRHINEPNISINDMLDLVRTDVHKESNGKQLPSSYTSVLGGPFFLNQSDKVKSSTISKISNTNVDYGGKSVESADIGKQVWMTKNLDVDHFLNGDPIVEARTFEEWKYAEENKIPAWCYYDNDPSNDPKFGKLYNWYAVNDPRGLAPKGWHVPTLAEWAELVNTVGENNSPTLKSVDNWFAGGNGSNNSKFAGLPGGTRYSHKGRGSASGEYGEFSGLGKMAAWWAITDKNQLDAWYPYLLHDSNAIGLTATDKGAGRYIRCLKD